MKQQSAFTGAPPGRVAKSLVFPRNRVAVRLLPRVEATPIMWYFSPRMRITNEILPKHVFYMFFTHQNAIGLGLSSS